MKYTPLIILLLFPILSSSQSVIEEIRSHSDVQWAFETSLVYDFNMPLDGKISSSSKVDGQAVAIVKNDFFDYMSSMERLKSPIESAIWEMIDENIGRVYTKGNKIISEDEFYDSIASTDTVIAYDPDTYEEQIMVVKSFLNFDYYEMDQIFYYSKSKKQIFSVIIEIRPMVFRDENETEKYIPFRFRPDINLKKSKRFDINDKNTSTIIATAVDIPMNKVLSKIDNESKRALKKSLWDDPTSGKCDVFYGEEWSDLVPYPKDEVSHLINGLIDTVISYDPETYEETIKVYHSDPFRFDQLESLLNTQYLTYNQKSKSLNCHPMIIGIMYTHPHKELKYHLLEVGGLRTTR